MSEIVTLEDTEVQVAEENGAVATFNALKETSAEDVVRAMQNKRTIELAEHDEQVSSQIDATARKLVKQTTETIANENEAQGNQAHFQLNKEACKMYGFTDSRPRWQQNLMKIGASLWFIIYFLIATVTVCPISVFFDVFKNIFKKAWLALVVAILVYLIVTLGVPAVAILKDKILIWGGNL